MSFTAHNTRQSHPYLTGFRGAVITAADPDYDQTRAVFYGDVDKRPRGIVRAADIEDIRRVLRIAREQGFELAVRSGGHSLAGHGTTEGGLVIDLRDLSRMEIDTSAGSAWIGAGATALRVTASLAEQGRAIGFGDAGSVGVGGITLSGGIGFLVRRFGLTIDSLLAAEVVTADGTSVRTDANHEPELFWALRGGGGNFGVVTRLQFKLRVLSEFTGGILILPPSPRTIAGFVAAASEAPDALSTIVNVMPAPPLPFLSAEWHGKLVVFALVAFAGNEASAQRAIAPLRSLATPLADTIRPMPYAAMFPPEDPGHRPKALVRTMFSSAFDEAAAETLVEYMSKGGEGMRVAQLRVLGGAVARVPVDATAFAHRSKPLMVNLAAFHQGGPDRAARKAWLEEFAQAVHPDEDAAYTGFLGDDGAARIRAAYPPATWDRLRRIKSIYDPANLFRLNHNIPPLSRP